MKRILCILLVITMLFLLTSCYDTFPKGGANHACVSFAVPGIYSYYPPYIHVMEKDAQGRTLMEFSDHNAFMADDYTKGYVICQKYDDDYVYFYEDYAYMFAFSATDTIEALKERNDWGKPLDESKMSRRTGNFTYDMALGINTDLDYDQVKNLVSQKLGVSREALGDLYFDDSDPNGLALFDLPVKDTTGQPTAYYFVLCDTAYNISLLKVEDVQTYDQGLREFKQANGWQYGF